MSRRIAQAIPALLGVLLIYSAVSKLLHPGPATTGLESLDVPYGWAKAIVASVTVLELYLGSILILRRNLRYAMILSTALIFVFTGYLFYLSTLAHPPSCGCLGLTGIFQNSRHEAIIGLARNCAILWLIKWSYDRHFPRNANVGRTQPDVLMSQSRTAAP